MSSPYPPQTPPRRLERSRSNKIIGGVCAGVARYLNMDVTLVRVLTVVLTFFTGVPVVAYIVALFVMPEEKQPPYAGPPNVHVPNGATGPTDPVWGPGGAPWEQTGDQAQSGATPPPPSSPPPSPSPSPHPAPSPRRPRRPPLRLPPKVGRCPTPSRLRRRRPRRPHPARRAAGSRPRPTRRTPIRSRARKPRPATRRPGRATNPRPDGYPVGPRAAILLRSRARNRHPRAIIRARTPELRAGAENSSGGEVRRADSLAPIHHSHSIVAGGLLVRSSTTRVTSRTSLVILVLMRSNTSYGSRPQSAVMASSLVTGRSTTG